MRQTQAKTFSPANLKSCGSALNKSQAKYPQELCFCLLEKQNKFFCPPCWWHFVSAWPRHMPRTQWSIKVRPKSPLLPCYYVNYLVSLALLCLCLNGSNADLTVDSFIIIAIGMTAYLLLTIGLSPKCFICINSFGLHGKSPRQVLQFPHFWRWAILWGKLYCYSQYTDRGTIIPPFYILLCLLGSPASLVTAQRRSPETSTETSRAYGLRNLTSLKEKVLEWHPCHVQQKAHGPRQWPLQPREIIYIIFRGKWCHVGPSVTRETRDWGKGQGYRQLLIKPDI